MDDPAPALVGLRVYRYRLPFASPLVLRGGRLEERHGLLLRAEGEGGAVGWGETAPLPGFSLETLDEAIAQVLTLRSAVEEKRWDEGMLPHLASSVRFGVETARYGLAAAERGEEGALFGVPGQREIAINGLITEADDASEQVGTFRSEGYRTVKAKVGGRTLQEDIERITALRDAAGPDLRIRLDANRAWQFDEAVFFAEAVRDLSIEYVEEPLADPSGLQRLVDQTGMRVALDESLPGLHPDDLKLHRYASAVVLKPTLLGGIGISRAFAEAARAEGMTCVVSSVFESGVGVTVLAQLASYLDVGDPAMGLDTYRRLAQDVIEPRLEMAGGRLDVGALAARQHGIRVALLEEL